MIEFDIGGQKYRMKKMDAFKQFHVSRRIAPIIPTLIPIFVKLSKDGSLLSDFSGLAEVLTPFADGLSNLSDEASEYVVSSCLSVVQREHGKVWADVWSVSGNVCMFDDMDLGAMIQVVIRVIQENLGPFIRGLLTNPESNQSSEG